MSGAEDLNPERIRQYMKLSKADITHLNACRTLFLETDVDETGILSKHRYLLACKWGHLKLNDVFLTNFLKDIQIEKADESKDAMLSYNWLMKVIDVYSKCPIWNKTDKNASENFT